MAGARVHRHKTCAKEELVVANGVHRCHYGILLALPAEHGHLFGRIERLLYLRLRGTRLLHQAVAVGLPHGASQNLVHLFLGEPEGIGRFLRPLLLFVEAHLQLFQVFRHRLFGILLHARVEGGVYLQPVGIEVVLAAVLLGVLRTPAVERIGLPVERVLVVLLHLPATVIRPIGLLGSQHAAQVLAEVGRRALLVVHAVVSQLQRQRLQGVALRLGDVSGFPHLVEHHVAPAASALVAAEGVIVRGVLAHAYQRGGFLNLQVFRLATEVGEGGSLDADRVVQEVELVEVHREDFLFGVVVFQLYGNHPFDGLLEQTLHHVARTGRIELLGELLGDGASATGILLHQDAALHHGTEQGDGVDARMLDKAHVLRGYQRIDDVGRQVVVAHEHAVLLAVRVGAQHLPVLREDLGGELVVRVFQILHGRHVAYLPGSNRVEYHNAHKYSQRYKSPQYNDDFLYHSPALKFIIKQ